MSYSLSEAARVLGVSPRTMATWVRELGVAPEPGGVDRRERTISFEALRQIAAHHRRPLVMLGGDDTLESVASRVEMLEHSFQHLQRKVDSLRGNLAERVLRSAHEGIAHDDRSAQPFSPVRLPPISVVQVIVQQAISLINAAPAPSDGDREILVTFQGEHDLFDLVPLLRGEWRRALERAMLKGWHVVHLIRRSDDLSRAMSLAEDLMQLLRGPQGAYFPMFTPANEAPSDASREFVVVPRVGILELSATTGSHIDTMTLHKPGRRFDTIHADLRQMRANAVPMFSAHPPLSVAFSRAIVSAERAPGNRYLTMYGLSDLTVPWSVYQQRVDGVRASAVDSTVRETAATFSELRQEREAVFERQIGEWMYREICPMAAVRRYVRTGVYSPDDRLDALGAPPLSPDQRRAHFTYLVDRLERHDKYELGLAEEVTPDAQLSQAFWLVKAGVEVLLECQSRRGKGGREEIDLVIREPRIVDAFYEHFLRQWARLVPANRDKRQVIAWLRAQQAEIPDP